MVARLSNSWLVISKSTTSPGPMTSSPERADAPPALGAAKNSTRPPAVSSTPKIENISPMGRRRSRFMRSSPEDQVEDERQPEDHGAERRGSPVPGRAVIGHPGGEGVDQAFQLLIRLAARRHQRDG